MNKIQQAVLAALFERDQKVSTNYLYGIIGGKHSISIPDFQALVRDLETQGYLHMEPAGRHAVLVSLTPAGRDGLARQANHAQPKFGRVAFALAVLCAIFAFVLFGPILYAHWQQLSARLALFRDPAILVSGQVSPSPAPATQLLAGVQATAQPASPTAPLPTGTPFLTATPLPSATPLPTETLLPTATPLPTDTPLPTATPSPLPPQEALSQVEKVEDLPGLNVRIQVRRPVIDPVVTAADAGFNALVQAYTAGQRQDVLDWLKEPVPGAGGGLSLDYSVVSATTWFPGETPAYFRDSTPAMPLKFARFASGHEVLAVLYAADGYFGGAHPSRVFEAINYDLTTATRLDLPDLFQPNTPYLQTIADYCISDLQKPQNAFAGLNVGGAAATRENYHVWSITPRGLLIVFGEYQVGPYSAGPQFVMVPYSVLQSMIDPQGPLGKLYRGN